MRRRRRGSRSWAIRGPCVRGRSCSCPARRTPPRAAASSAKATRMTESLAVDEVCFVQAFRDVLGIGPINTNWLEYVFQTDSGLALEICRKQLGRDPSGAEITSLQSRFAELL